jgi:hypothetical protein
VSAITGAGEVLGAKGSASVNGVEARVVVSRTNEGCSLVVGKREVEGGSEDCDEEAPSVARSLAWAGEYRGLG